MMQVHNNHIRSYVWYPVHTQLCLVSCTYVAIVYLCWLRSFNVFIIRELGWITKVFYFLLQFISTSLQIHLVLLQGHSNIMQLATCCDDHYSSTHSNTQMQSHLYILLLAFQRNEIRKEINTFCPSFAHIQQQTVYNIMHIMYIHILPQ